MEQLSKDLWRLEIPLVGSPLKTLNSYLILGAERSLLIDTGFRQEPCREAMEQQLSALGVDRNRLDIFLTHLHSDHTGLAPELIPESGQIYISRADGPGVCEAADDHSWRRLYAAYVREGFSQEEADGFWNSNPAQTAAPKNWRFTPLEDGGTLFYGGHTLQCILTPGHTPGHMCLYEPEEGWFFSGDHVLFHITPNICRWERLPDALGSYLDSLERVRELPVRLLLPAHRSERGDLVQRINELKEHHAKRLASARHIVEQNPGLTAYEIAGLMRWSIRCQDWKSFPLTQKFFAVGEALSHLDHLEAKGLILHREAGGVNRYYGTV
ncbi:MAG: MBL fold metallo-hydrolase [Oscillibacter sp.]|jgi:glyoxylase-like metal-dependent hydrolase (beta-lactamase superfamily II)|nr:MBL fold metallo-hydrolase [Oscillibacter sp.]